MHKALLFLSFLASIVTCYEVNDAFGQMYVLPYNLYYDAPRDRMIFTDYLNNSIICVDFKSGQISTAVVRGIPFPTFLIPLKSNSSRFVVSNGLPLKIIEWNCRDPVAMVVRDAFTVETDPKYSGNLWDSAIGTPQCGLVGGAYRPNLCGNDSMPNTAAYIYTRKCGVTRFIEDIKSSGTMEFSKTNKLYHVSICENVVREFDYNPKTEKISGGRIVFRYEQNFGDGKKSYILGVTVDDEGFLYITVYYGGVLLKVNPKTGKIVLVINMPAEVVGSLAWGGQNLDKLYVATLSKAFDFDLGGVSNRTFSPGSGRIYVLTGLNATGPAGRPVCL